MHTPYGGRADGRKLTLIAAPFTALDQEGDVDLKKVEAQAEVLVGGELRGAFVCGTTGEGASLSTLERAQLAEQWCKVAGHDLEIIVHVGHASLTEARSLAEHAEKMGAGGIAAVAPYYYKPRDVDELAGFCAEVARDAPRTPFYYYHIPSMTGVNLSMARFLEVAAEQIPTLAGIKFTHEDLVDFGRCVDVAGDGYEVFFGRDEMLLAGLILGSYSAVGSTYNVAAPLYDRMFRAFERGDLRTARQTQSLSRSLVEVAEKHGGIPAFKTMMRWVGVDCGPCRLPLRTLDDSQLEILDEELGRIGFHEWTLGDPQRIR